MSMNTRMLSLISLLTLFSAAAFSEDLSARLIIAGPEDPIYTYWGHIGIAIENKATGEDLFYDFGNFSFYAENFYKDFARGYMWYLGLVTSTKHFIASSMAKEMDLASYPLNLGSDELRELDEILRWWVLPENQRYLYNYFTNNCSTIIRDILNQVTDGQLKAQAILTEDRNFRHYARTGSYQSLPAEVMFHYLLGPFADKTIDGWELMYLPSAVADFAANFEYTGRDGVRRVLLGEKTVLKQSSRPPVPEEPRTLWPLLCAISVLMAMFWYLASKHIGWKIVQLLIVLIVGLPGAILGYFIVFTNHSAANGNLNLWPTFPTVLLSLIPIFAVKWKRRDAIIAGIWTINLAGLLLAIFLRLSGLIVQDAGAIWALYGPITLTASYPGFMLKKSVGL